MFLSMIINKFIYRYQIDKMSHNNHDIIFVKQYLEHLIWLYVHEASSFENEALENEDRSSKHPKLENEAP